MGLRYGVVEFLCFCLVLQASFVYPAPVTEEYAICRSDADCSSTECCVGFDRRRFIFVHQDHGFCRPLRFQGQGCHVFLIKDPYNPNLHVNFCPCEADLECRGTTIDGANSTHAVHHNPLCLPVH